MKNMLVSVLFTAEFFQAMYKKKKKKKNNRDTHTLHTHIFLDSIRKSQCTLPNSFYDLAEILITNINSRKEIQVNIFHEN